MVSTFSRFKYSASKNSGSGSLKLKDKRRRLQGMVKEIIKTGEKKVDDEGNEWEKCIFIIELTGFSKRTPNEVLPQALKRAKVKVIRWCCFDWHYKVGVRATLTPEETERVLAGTLDLTVAE